LIVKSTSSNDLFKVIGSSGNTIYTVENDGDVILNGLFYLNTSYLTGLTSGTTTLSSVLKTSGKAVFIDYWLMTTIATPSGLCMRTGTVMGVWDGTNILHTDTSTNDLNGSTLDVKFDLQIVGSNVNLNSVIINSLSWDIKVGIRVI
jgi:hypothetical protein